MILLSFKFREFGSVTSLSVVEAANAGAKKLDEDKPRGDYIHSHSWYHVLTSYLELSSAELSVLLMPFDLKRLEPYANNTLRPYSSRSG